MSVALGVCILLILLLALLLKESMQDTTNMEIHAINRGYAYYHHATKKFT